MPQLAHDRLIDALPASYRGDVVRIIKSAEARCGIDAMSLTATEIVRQMLLRSVMLKRPSFYKERAALKAWFSLQADIPYEAARLMDLTGADQMREGDRMMERMIADRLGRDPGSIDVDVRSEISGVISRNTMRKRVKQGKNLPTITAHDLSTLEIWLKSGTPDPVAGLMSLASPTSIIPQNSIAPIIARAVWLAGLRPVEIFSARILLERSGRIIMRSGDLDDEMQRRSGQSGSTGALLAGQLIQEIASEMNAMPILTIRNAKTANANPDILKEFRILHLDYIDASNLGTLWLCSWLRYAGRVKSRQTSIKHGVTRALVRASQACFPGRQPITLYTLRHDFCSRVKKSRGLAAAAVLMGHTSLQSTYAYGRRIGNSRKSTTGSSWLPQPEISMLEIMKGRIEAAKAAALARRLALRGDAAPRSPLLPETQPPAYILEHSQDWDVWNDGREVLGPDMET